MPSPYLIFRGPFMAVVVAAGISGRSAETPTRDARRDLAPSGTLRAAINLGNPILANRDAAAGEPRGVSVDLARELARWLGVPVQLITYPAAGQVVEGIKSGAWDIAFFAI